jgi:hypothetical protein
MPPIDTIQEKRGVTVYYALLAYEPEICYYDTDYISGDNGVYSSSEFTSEFSETGMKYKASPSSWEVVNGSGFLCTSSEYKKYDCEDFSRRITLPRRSPEGDTYNSFNMDIEADCKKGQYLSVVVDTGVRTRRFYATCDEINYDKFLGIVSPYRIRSITLESDFDDYYIKLTQVAATDC